MTLGGSITVQALAARPVYQTTESEFVLSALLKVQPQDRSAKRVPAVVALVIEYGPGMEHERHSEQAQQTARRIIEGLLPDDLISLTIYGERAKLVMPAEPVGDGSKAKRLVGFLDAHSLGAGANLNLALKLAADDLRLRTATGTAKRVLVLAATGTLPSSVAQERDAEAVGRTLAEEGVGIDTFGFGPDWNMGLLARLAEAGRGAMHHIPRSMDALPAARDAVQDLSALAFADVRIHVRFAKGVRLRRFMQVFPTVAHWLPLQPSEREAVTRLGDLAGKRQCDLRRQRRHQANICAC
jgi:Ca-activated chloride channel family protein